MERGSSFKGTNDFALAYRKSWGLMGPLAMEIGPSRPIRCDVWIVEQLRYPTNQPTDRPLDTARYDGEHLILQLLFRLIFSTMISMIMMPKIFSRDKLSLETHYVYVFVIC